MYTCGICLKSYARVYSIKKHIREAHLQRFSCLYCPDKYYVFPMDMIKHVRNKHPDEELVVKCPYCSDTYSRFIHIVTHIENEHPEVAQEGQQGYDEPTVYRNIPIIVSSTIDWGRSTPPVSHVTGSSDDVTVYT